MTDMAKFYRTSKRDIATLAHYECRCGHDEYEHDEDGVCMSPTTEQWPHVLNVPCTCGRFRVPDSDD